MTEISKVFFDYKDVLDVELMLGNVCNFKCHYCFPGSNEGDIKWPKDKYNLFLKNTLSLFDFYKKNFNKKRFYIKPLGGEPTLWPLLSDYLENIRSRYEVFIRMSTNASRSLRYWKDNHKHFDEIIISVHNEFSDPDHIIDVANFLYETKSCNLYVNVLMDPANWDKSLYLFKYLQANSEHFHLGTEVVVFNGVSVYDDRQKEELRNLEKRQSSQPFNFENEFDPPVFYDKNLNSIDISISEIFIQNLNKWNGYKCNVGIDRIYMDKTGKVGGACGQQFFSEPLNLFEENLDLRLQEFTPVICRQTICPCASEIILTKEKI
jgi:organic radical activating enzyme